MKLSRTELETLAVLNRTPDARTETIAKQLGIPVIPTLRNRLQRLRRKGVVRSNGKRGAFARWSAVPQGESLGESVSMLTAVAVHREAAALGRVCSAHELAHLLDLPLDEVTTARAYLVSVGAVEPHGRQHLQARRPAVVRRGDLERTVRRWHDLRSQAEKDATSTHSLDALINELAQLLA